jgi:hypothetical protein
LSRALSWARRQEHKRLLAATQRERSAAELRDRIAGLRQARRRPEFGTWYGENFGWVNQHQGQRYLLHALLWLAGGYLWIPLWYKRSAPAEEARLNAEADRQIHELEARLRELEGGS